jgi:hypothetical protein
MFSCSYYNFTIVNGSISYTYHFVDQTRSNLADFQLGEILIDHVENKVYFVITFPPSSANIFKLDWVPVNSTDVVAFAGCYECGFYGTQDAGRNLFNAFITLFHF